MRTKLILLSGLAVMATGAFAQTASVAGTVGIYFPSSSTIRNLIGSQFLTYGITPWSGNSNNGGLTPEIDFITGSGNGNTFLLVPVVYAYEKDFTSHYSTGVHTGTSFVPYLRISAGVAYFDYNITDSVGSDYSLQRLGGTAGLEAGLKITNSAKVFVKYNLFTKEQQFDFSGIQIGLTLSLFKL
jgi:hypothetical protein